MADTPLVEMRKITKNFPGVRALTEVDLTFRHGEIHALVGENGAGKTTIMRILAGVYPHGTYEGQILIDGKEHSFGSVKEAEKAGVVMIPQELMIMPHLTVAENMFLNNLPTDGATVNWSRLFSETQMMLDRLHVRTTPFTEMRHLTAGQAQLVLVANALHKQLRVLILDESAASLPMADVELLFKNMRNLKAQGITCVYITHKIAEVMAVADRVTVLRDGHLVGGDDIQNVTEDKIVSRMVGREITEMYPRESHERGRPALEVRDLTLQHPQDKTRSVVKKVSFTVHEGEIVGMYGLIGAGRTELVKGIFGAYPGERRGGEVFVYGKPVVIGEPGDAMAFGMGLLPEERKREGLITGKSVATNITIASLRQVATNGVVNPALEYQTAKEQVDALRVKTPSMYTPVDYLSGGNQQKVVLAKWLAANCKILLLDEPTKGIDIGAKVEIFHILNRLARQGVAVLFISSMLPEVLGVADRILIMREGELVADLDWREATEQTVIQYALGRKENGE
jgi:D-xylose transport system ATP-binding protein